MTNQNKGILLVIAVLFAILAGVALWTKPTVPTATESSGAAENALLQDPLSAQQVHHMQEAEKIDFGADATHDISILVEKSKIHVVLAEKFLQQHGGTELLSKLSVTERENWFTPAQYQHFLERLHEAVGQDDDDHESAAGHETPTTKK
jgi:hypothetical protein